MLSSSIKTVSSISTANRLNELFTACSWLVVLGCTPWWSPASKTLSQGSCVYECLPLWHSLLLLLLLMFCLFHGVLSMKALCFLSLLVHSLWSVCLGRVDVSSRNYTFYNLYPICSCWASLSFKISSFFLWVIVLSVKRRGSVTRQKIKRSKRACSEVLGWTQTQDVVFTVPQASGRFKWRQCLTSYI